MLFGRRQDAAPLETPEQVSDGLARGEIHLVDVREQGEWSAGRIAGAVFAPLSSFDPAQLPKGRPVVLYCGSGKRSETAFRKCLEAGVRPRGHLAGGISAWIASGRAVDTGGGR